MKIAVELGVQEETQLLEKAQRLNIRPETLATALLADVLQAPSADFDRAADRVLQKNRELYRRLG